MRENNLEHEIGANVDIASTRPPVAALELAPAISAGAPVGIWAQSTVAILESLSVSPDGSPAPSSVSKTVH